jgi:hypothetical protein
VQGSGQRRVGVAPPQRCPLPGWERRASRRTVMASNREPARVLPPAGCRATTVQEGWVP